MRLHPGPFFCLWPSTAAMPASSLRRRTQADLFVLTSPSFGRISDAMSMRRLGALLGGLGVLGVLSCTGTAPAGEPAPSEARASSVPAASDINQQFAGTWRLIGVERLDADDRPLPPPAPPAFGAPNGVGFLMYDPAGYMGVVIMQDARAVYADTRPTADEARRTLSSYTSYFGTYTIDEDAGIITHHVEGNLHPNGTGVDNRRAYELDDDTLVLMPPRGSSGVQLRITWRREPELPGLTAEHRKFIGFWRYTSIERRADDGQVLPAASWENGFVIYTESGHMAVHLVRPDRQPYAASQPTDEEVLSALGSYASYFGPYTIDLDERLVVHDRIGNLRPSGVNTLARRGYAFMDDTLILQPPATMVDGREVKSFLTWTRLSEDAPTGGYRLVAGWPNVPSGTFFGQQEGWPDQTARDATAAARRAAAAGGRGGRGGGRSATPPLYGQGVSGIAIDENDHLYVFNRGRQTILVFDRDGNLIRSGGEMDMDGVQVAGGWLHSGEVDWEGNVWVVERLNHRILKFNPTLDRAVMQLGTTGEPGTDETHLNSPSGILFTRAGNIVVTDGYGNNRVILFSPDGTFIKQVGRGAGGPDDKGRGPGEWDLPHQGAVDADDTLYLLDREGKRIQVFDNQLNYIREFANDGWNPWDIAISRQGDDGFGYIADHAGERVHKISLVDGRILATWGGPGRGPGQFDWVHGMAVDTQGAVYAADTYGQRVQKFAPVSGSR